MPKLAALQKDSANRLETSLPAASPMRVYLNTELLGAIDALAAQFPVTREIVGARKFEALALAFARRHSLDVPILVLQVRAFPEWLESHDANRERPYLADVARCEQLRSEALVAPDAPVLAAEDLTMLPPDRRLALKLRTHPATRFGWFATPAMAIWAAHQHGTDGALVPERRSAGAIFVRQGIGVLGFELDSPSHRLLAGMRMGETLGAATQAAAMLYPDADLPACFGRLVNCGAFAALPKG